MSTTRRSNVFQVRQLHAHAWVEAFLDPSKIPQSLRQENPSAGPTAVGCGWMERPATTLAAPRPIARRGAHGRPACTRCSTTGNATSPTWTAPSRSSRSIRRFASSAAEFSAGRRGRSCSPAAGTPWSRLLQSGIIGKLAAGLLVISAAAALVLVVRRLTRLAKWLWRRLLGRVGSRARGTRISVEFYRRFEQVAAQPGYCVAQVKRRGSSPSRPATRLAKLSGRPELCDCAAQVAEAFYRVRFGRQKLDAAAAAEVQKAIEELKAGVAAPRTS